MVESRCRPHPLVPLALLLALPPLTARADGPDLPLHVASLVELTVDDAPADSARVEGAFGEALTAAGFTRISAAAAGIPDAAAAEKGAGHPAADLVVVARVESRELAAGIGGTRLVRYEASADARVLVTETGELLGTLTAEGPGIDVDPASAARIAGAHAAEALAKQLVERLPALAAAPRALELRIAGLPDGAEADRVAGFFAEHPAIDVARVLSREGEGEAARAVLRLTVRGLSAADIARHIEETAGLGLRVEGHTLRRVHAVFDPARRLRLTVAVAPLVNATGVAAEDRMVAPLTRVLRSALAGAPAIAVGSDDPPFTVRGTLRYSGEYDVTIALRLTGPDGAVVATRTVTGPGKRFSRTVRKAARALGRDGLAKAHADADLRRVAGLPLRPPEALIAATAPVLEGLDIRPAHIDAPLVAEVRLARAPGDGRLTVRDGEHPWVERTADRSADGRVRVFEGPPRADWGAVDVVATLQSRRDGRWQSERVQATGVVRPELVARWHAQP